MKIIPSWKIQTSRPALSVFAILALNFLGPSPTLAVEPSSQGQTSVVMPASDKIEITAAVPRNWPPHYTSDSAGNPDGFAIEAFNEIARIANVTVHYKVYDSFTKALM
jgi:hypothetical protein